MKPSRKEIAGAEDKKPSLAAVEDEPERLGAVRAFSRFDRATDTFDGCTPVIIYFTEQSLTLFPEHP